ncbi:MAG: MFS transporter [Rhizonema sp. PD38]|nr:MFS transporter [Rhizonema sp. PD38]
MKHDLSDTTRSKEAEVPKSARLAVAAVFFVGGAGLANWVARIPEIQQKLGLSNGDLGIALLGTAVGAVLAMPIAGWLVARFGCRPVTKSAALGFCIVLPLPTLAPNLPLLTISLIVLGALFGGLDVSMNTQAVAVEQRYHRPIMSSFHGLYSAGGMVGAASGGLIASLGINPKSHLIGAALLLGILVAFASIKLLRTEANMTTESTFALPTRSLLQLGIVAFCVMLSEGAMADWSAVYLSQTLTTGPGLAAAGYTMFSLAMAVCRLSGDRPTEHLGPVRMVRFGGTIAAIGLGLSLIIAQPFVTLIGFACVGVGLSTLVPIVFSAAGRTPGIPSSQALAAVTTTGYCGFLCGPPLIGFVADFLNLHIALGLVVVMCAMSAVLAPTVARGQKRVTQ